MFVSSDVYFHTLSSCSCTQLMYISPRGLDIFKETLLSCTGEVTATFKAFYILQDIDMGVEKLEFLCSRAVPRL